MYSLFVRYKMQLPARSKLHNPALKPTRFRYAPPVGLALR